MRLFDRKRKRKYKRQPKTLKQILSDSLIREVNKDPELKRELALRESGFADVIKKLDPVEIKKREFDTKATTRALDMLDDDEELAKEVYTAKLMQLIGEGGKTKYKGSSLEDFIQPGGNIAQVLEELEAYDELKDRLGGNKNSSWADLFKNPETVAALVGLLQSLGGGQALPKERVVVIEIDGKPTEVTESQYNRLLKENRVRPIGMIEAPKEEAPIIKEPAEPTPSTEEPIPEVELPKLESIDLPSLVWMLELSPDEFVSQLHEDQEAGLPHASLLLEYLPNLDTNGVISRIEPYRSNSQAGPYIERLLTDEGKVWIEEVLARIKSGQVNV